MYCIHCRKLNRNGARTCKHCGKSLLRKRSVSQIYRKSDKSKKEGSGNSY